MAVDAAGVGGVVAFLACNDDAVTAAVGTRITLAFAGSGSARVGVFAKSRIAHDGHRNTCAKAVAKGWRAEVRGIAGDASRSELIAAAAGCVASPERTAVVEVGLAPAIEIRGHSGAHTSTA